jgi:hypothetical protein
MTKSYDQTFMLTTSLVVSYKSTQEARIPQSALETVRSVECGLFA